MEILKLKLYNDNKVNSLHIMLPRTRADVEKQFDSEPIYNKESVRTKIKSHGDKLTDFYF